MKRHGRAAETTLHLAAAPTSLVDRVDAVVVGASAGGVEAIAALLPSLPAGLRAAVIVVLHLPRERPSLLVDIFGPKCALPIVEAEDKEPVTPGTVYLAPPDYHLLIDAGPSLALSTDPPVHYSRPSIDVLFESAADHYRDRVAAVLLTGANADGAAGAAAVRRAGGITVVQHPDDAMVATMPEAALARFAPTHVLSLDGIGRLLATLAADRPAPPRHTARTPR